MTTVGREPSVCLLTGSSGYLGGRVAHAFREQGWRVVEVTRRPSPDTDAIRHELGADLPAGTLPSAAALVHCAYDFSQRSWRDIHRINVEGSARLMRAARAAGVPRTIYISSISAFPGCRSLYGAAKLETEAIAQELGAVVIRPGLIWGNPPGAMFGSLVTQVDGARVVPLVGGGTQVQFLVHEHDLSDAIVRFAAGDIAPSPHPVTIANEEPHTMRQLLERIGAARGKKLSCVSVPWRPVWAALKLAEALGLPTPFRSDSLVSLMYQNPRPSFGEQRQLGISCRPFTPESLLRG